MNQVTDNKQVSYKIDELMKGELKAHPERLVAFFARVQLNYDEAIRTATRFFLSMLAAWLLTYAIYKGSIETIKIYVVDLDRKMIVVSPFVIGLLTYGLLSALAGAVVLWEALSRGVDHMLPTAAKYNLDDLLAPPTFSNVERMLENASEKKLPLFSRAWFVLITAMMFGGSLAALVHTTCLLFLPPPDKQLAVFGIGSATFGSIAWVRGVVLFKSAIDATGGGFHLGHHRGSRRLVEEGMLSTEPLSQDSSQDS